MKDRKSIFDIEDNQPDHVLPKAENVKLKDISLMMKNMEKTMKLSLEGLNTKLSSKILDLEKIQAEQFIKINSLSNNFNPEKDNTEKISELIAWKKKTNDQIISHEFKLTQFQKDLSNATYKYDKMYLDNLIIPGTIGDYCRYRNLKEYLEYNIIQVQNLNSYKEKNQLDLKNYKEKLDMMMKSLKTQIESIEQNSNNFTLKMIQDSEAKFKKELESVNEKFNDVRMENNKYSVQLQKTATEITIDYEKLLTIKSEIINEFDGKVDQMQLLHKKTFEEFDDLRIEYEKIKSKFNDLSDFLREAKKPQNLNTSVKDMRKLSSKLSFSENKNLKKSYANNNDSQSMDENNTSFQNAKNANNFSFKKSNSTSNNLGVTNNLAIANRLGLPENHSSNVNSVISNFNKNSNNLRYFADKRSVHSQGKLGNSSFDNKNNNSGILISNLNNNSNLLGESKNNSNNNLYNFNSNLYNNVCSNDTLTLNNNINNSNNLNCEINNAQLNKNVYSNSEISGNFKFYEANKDKDFNLYQSSNNQLTNNNFNCNDASVNNNNNNNFSNMIMTTDENKKLENAKNLNDENNINNDNFKYYASNNQNKAFNNQDLNFEIDNNANYLNSNNNNEIAKDKNNQGFNNKININNPNSTRNKQTHINNTNSDNSLAKYSINMQNTKRKNLKDKRIENAYVKDNNNFNNKANEDLNNLNHEKDKNSSDDSFSQDEEYRQNKNEKGKIFRNKPLTATGRKAFNIVYYIRNYSIDLFEKNEKEEFLRRQKSINELYKFCDKFKFLNDIIFIFNEFNDSLSFFKKEFIKKITNTDQRIIQIENFWKKKMEELALKIKNYLPINFNPYLKNYGLPEMENEELSALQKEEKYKKILKNKLLNKKEKDKEKFVFASNKNVTDVDIECFAPAKNFNLNNFGQQIKLNNAYSQGKVFNNTEKERFVTFANTLNIGNGNGNSMKEISNSENLGGFNINTTKNLLNLAESMKQINLTNKQHLLFDVKKMSKEKRNLNEIICKNLHEKSELSYKKEDSKLKDNRTSEINTDRSDRIKDKKNDKTNNNFNNTSSYFIANGTINKNENNISSKGIRIISKNYKNNVDDYKKVTQLKNNLDLVESALYNVNKNKN